MGQFFAAADVEAALTVAKCESNLDPGAVNPRGPYVGLFQHAQVAWEKRAADAGWAGASPYDPVANTAVAAYLVYQDGWWHWPSCAAFLLGV